MGHLGCGGAKGGHPPILGGEGFVGGLVGVAGEEAGDGDVFVECFPVEPEAADARLFALLRRGAQEAGKPGEGNAEDSSVLRSTHMPRLKRTWVGTAVELTEEVIPCSFDWCHLFRVPFLVRLIITVRRSG